jgi:uncharacterized protein YegJ (DUF2314 family)
VQFNGTVIQANILREAEGNEYENIGSWLYPLTLDMKSTKSALAERSLWSFWSRDNNHKMKRILIFAIYLFLVACSPAPTQTPTQVLPTQLNKDVEMEAAFQQARATLDSFIEKIEKSHPDRTLVAVKVRFALPDGSTQDLWVDRIAYQNGSFHGTMGDDIPTLKLSVDDKITIKKDAIVDWMIVEDGKLIGGFTIRLAFQRMSPEQKERFLETVNYSIGD